MAEVRRALRAEPPLQVAMFETDDDKRYTNTLDLYDIAPRFVFYTDSREGSGHLKSIKREFEHGGVPYKLVLRPGRIIHGDGTERDEFPGEREQIVEAVIHRLATERGKLLVQNEKVRLTFSLYEIREELRKVKHLFNMEEIRDALTILHTANVEITRVDRKTTQILSSSSFPTLAHRRQESGEQAYLEFNVLVEQAIKHLQFRHMNYEWLMRISHPLSRWLYKRMCQSISNVAADGWPLVTMTALEIARDGGVPPRSRVRDTLRYVAAAVDVLVGEGLIEPGGRVTHKEGRKFVDVSFDLRPTEMFMGELRRADLLADDARRRLRLVAGTEEPATFVKAERSVSSRARSERKQLALVGMDRPAG